MAEKIKLDENLTINQVLNLTGRGQKGTLKENIQKAGLSLDDKFSSMRGTEFLKKLNEVGTEGNFTELTSVEKSLRELFNIEDTSGKFPFGDKTTFGSKGKARSPALNLEKADQARRAIEVELPSVKELNQSVHTATQKLVALGDNATKNKKFKDATKFYEAAALLQVKHHTGLRTMDIVNLTTGKPEMGSKYGTVVKGSDRLLQISNKGDRTNFKISSMPMGILQYLAEVNGTDDPNKSVKLFRTKKASLESTINEAVNSVFKQNNIFIRDQNTGEPKKFTIGLLRKNLFDAIDEDYGAGVANRLLGHSTKGDVGLTHYKVVRTSRAKLDINTLAAEQFNSTYLIDIGQSSPQKVMSSYKFSKKFFPIEPVVKLTSANPVEEAIQKTGLNLESRSVGAGVAIENIVEDNERQISRLEKQITKIEDLKTQADQLKGKQKNTQQTVNKEMVDSHNKRIQDLKDKLKGNRLLETAIILGAGAEGAKELFDDPVGLAKDVIVDVGATALLGPTGGLAVVEALRPSPAYAPERNRREEQFTTKEEEGQKVVDISEERDFRKDISPQLDDEQEVGKEMMLKYKRETALQDMRAKTKSKLDEQLQQLNIGRQ